MARTGWTVRCQVPRLTIAGVSLVSASVAWYLHLWKLGQAGVPLACSVGGGCVRAQMSRYGWFLGVDVALIGAVGYAAVVVVALVGMRRATRDARWPVLLLMALIYPAVLFTLRLKYAEFVVLRTFCPWCAVSTVAITIDAILITWEWARVQAATGVGDFPTQVPPRA